ncbi:MAG TPA: type II secretion system F family protein [Verrucomicrobiae bacterium]|nr:type II secretion system F family protein [Verrucomicrobiae bacterium]
MSLFFIIPFVFLATASVVVTVILLVAAMQTSPQARIRKRLGTLIANPTASQRELRALLKDSSYSEIPWLQNTLTRTDFVRRVAVVLERANLDITPAVFILMSVSVGVAIMVLMSVFGWDFFASLLSGLAAATIPYAYASFLSRRRLRRFLEQLPNGLDLISQGLKAGMGLTQAMVFVAKEVPDPMGTEFSIFMEEMKLGLPLNDALKGLQNRMPLAEVRLLGTAMLVQKEIGGSLAELLTKLSDVVRDRFRIERQIKTLTAQNRLSIWVMSLLPPAVAGFVSAIDPKSMNAAWHSPVGKAMLLIACGFEIVGILTFRKLARVHI